ncbi:MAG: guanylate kinase [Oscillospiraceae bacterium]|nr:guanylate kinase [Oscillospiraceae bacterium]
MKKGLLIVLSGPSGAGKGTVLGKFFAAWPNAAYSVSATTRAPRPGEVDGQHYFFMDKPRFEELIEKGEFLEYASYAGNYYGTPAKKVEELRNQGRDVVLEIEVQGGLQVKQRCPDATMIFLSPSTFEILESRLRGRGTENEETIQRRMTIAREEYALRCNYDYHVINDELEKALSDLMDIVKKEKEK